MNGGGVLGGPVFTGGSAMKKRKLIFSVLLLTLSLNALAWTWLLAPITEATIWLGRFAATNYNLARAFEWTMAGTGAIATAVWLGRHDEPATNTSGVQAKLIVKLKQDEPRMNPDPTRWNDPTPGAIDPTPKTSYTNTDVASYPVIPGSYNQVLDDMGAPSQKYYRETNTGSTQYRDLASKVWYTHSNGQYDYNGPTQFPTKDDQGRSSVYYRQTSASPCGTTSGTYGQANYIVYPPCQYQQVYSKQVNISCADGFVASGSQCLLANAANAKKPAGTPCEVVRLSNGTWDLDAKNPECATFTATNYLKSISASKIRAAVDQDTYVDIDALPSGGRQIDVYDASAKRTFVTGPYDPQTDGFGIQTISDSGAPPNSNSGAGTGSGTSGTAVGSCGGTGQPACGIDDAGFDGKATDGNGLLGKITANDQSITDKLNSTSATDTHGINWSWIPVVPRVACTPFQFGTGAHSMTFDLCETFSVIRQALGWLLYILTAWGLFDLFTQGTSGNKRSK